MILENEKLKVTFEAKGGEVYSVFDKQLGIEYMYQGNTEFWSGKNPTLFPIVGNTYSKDYMIDGKTYAMNNHGLVRTALLDYVEGDNSVSFVLKSDASTLEKYPFDFSYSVTYRLSESNLEISYKVVNLGDKDMPFTFGLHPGFRCPLLETEESFEDYTFLFEKEEECLQWDYESDAYHRVNVKEVKMDYSLFEEQPTLIYKGVESTKFTLKGKEHGVELDTSGNKKHYSILALWTPKRGAPFLCIEPWYATGDLCEGEKDFYKRDGTIILKKEEVFTTGYRVTFF